MGSNQPITQGNRNPLLGRVAGADGLKTGHTAEAGYGFTGSAEQNGRRIVMVVAGSAELQRMRVEENRCASWNGASTPGSRGRCSARASGSARRGCSSAAPRRSAWSRRATSRSPIPPASARICAPGSSIRARSSAPIAQGQHIADLVVETADMPPQTMPLVAAEAVGEAGFFGRIWLGLKSLVGLA